MIFTKNLYRVQNSKESQTKVGQEFGYGRYKFYELKI